MSLSESGNSPRSSSASVGVDRVDHEALMVKYQKDLTAYGLDSIQVSTIHKELRANDRTLFDDKTANSGYVKFSRDYLALEWHVVDFAPSKTAALQAGETAAAASIGPAQTFEADQKQDLEDKEPESNATTTPNERCRLFSTFYMPDPKTVDDRVKPAPYSEKLGEEVAINCSELNFKFGSVEPFFCTMALYDQKDQRKISEDFVFHLNNPEMMALVNAPPEVDPALKAKKAIFRLSPQSKHSQIFVVITVSKVLKAELDAHYDLYSKTTMKDKERSKAVAEIVDNCRRLSQLRQNFVWGAAQLFKEDGSCHDGVLEIDLVRIKGDMFGLIDDFTNPKKKREPLGTFTCDVTTKATTMIYPNRLTPSFAPIHPFDEKQSDRTKEVQEFTSPSEVPYPYVAYVNNYYFYIQKVDLTALPASVSHRNIVVEVKVLDNDSNPAAPGLPVIYGTAAEGRLLTDRYLSTVQYHNEAPKLFDEVAIKLPIQVHDKHHLMITYYHVNCKPPKKNDNSPIMVPVAYSMIKLLKDHQIIRQKNVIRIATKIEPGYLANEEKITYLENKKAQLTMYARVISSIYPLEGALHKFLRTCEWDVEKESDKIVAAMKGLFDEKTNKRQIVRYLPVALRGVFQQIACTNNAVASEAFHTLLGCLAAVTQWTKEGAILESYVQYVFDYTANQTPRALYERLVYWWLQVVREQDDTKNLNWLRYSWFLFGIIAKSMAFTLKDCGMLGDEATRSKRFSSDYLDLLSLLINAFGNLVRDNHKVSALASEIPRFNIEIAHFFTDLLRMMDRGVVFDMISGYLLRLADKSIEMYAFKFLLLKVLTQDPQYVPLSLPGHSPTFKSVREAPKKFYARHFMVGVVLQQVESAFNTGNQQIVNLAIDALCDVFWLHDHDKRLAEDQRRRVSQMYFPFMITVVDKAQMLANAPQEFVSKVLACFMWVLQGISESLVRDYIERESEKRTFIFLSLIELALDIFQWKDKQYAMVKRAVPLQPNKFFTVGYIDRGEAIAPAESSASSGPRATQSKFFKPADATGGANPTTSPGGGSPGAAAGKKDSKKKDTGKKDKKKEKGADADAEAPEVQNVQKLATLSESEAVKEANFVREISHVALDIVLLINKNFQRMLRFREPFEKFFSVVINLLAKPQPVSFLSVLLEKVYMLTQTFSARLFAKANSTTPDLVYHVLRLCNSAIDATRSEAASLYAFLFESNFSEVKNVDRVRLQTTIGVIKFLGSANSLQFNRLLNSVKSVREHFRSNATIGQVLEGLDTKIRSIITDHKKMNLYEYDPETMVDLFYQVSRQLIDSPDERITWLENLSQYHLDKGNLEEAAQAKIITAALIQGYLKGFNRWNTKMVPAFHLVCPQIKDEVDLPDFSRLKAFKDEICQSANFSADGFATLVTSAIELFKKGGYFENAAAAYRMLLPIYQEAEDYEAQKQCHHDLYNICRNLTDDARMKQRIFSNYYRVSFFGEKFGAELDGNEYIYKEMNTLRLSDVSDYFIKQYSAKFGADNFVLLQHNKPVQRSDLDPQKAYMQLCAVEIYLTPEELEDRGSTFKQHFGANRFVMETPFTKSGKAHGELDEQFLRRTIFTTESSYPYLKKRLKVVSKSDVELNPIETAMNLFEKKIQALKGEISQTTPNLKTLQMILQGTLLTQVNAGAGAVIKIFLSDEAASKNTLEDREKMANLVTDFVRCLAVGLKLNKSFMDPTDDQMLLHSEMEKGMERFEQLLNGCSIFANKKDRFGTEDSLSLSGSTNSTDSPSSVSRSTTKKGLLSGSGSSDTPTRSGTRKIVLSAPDTAKEAATSASPQLSDSVDKRGSQPAIKRDPK